jgi:hypothetical protein
MCLIFCKSDIRGGLTKREARMGIMARYIRGLLRRGQYHFTTEEAARAFVGSSRERFVVACFHE